MSGIEDLLGKLVNEEFLKSMAEGMKEGMKEGSCSHATPSESWCHVNGDKPVKNWIVLRVNDTGSTCGFDKMVACYKKKLALFLNAMPEGQGAVFLPSNVYLEVTPAFGLE